MMQVINEITVDVAKYNFFNAIVAKQYDRETRFLRVHLVNDGKPLDIDPLANAVINARREDKDKKSFGGTVEADGSLLLPITHWMLELDGTVQCDVSIIRDTQILTSTLFEIAVQYAANGTEDVSEDDENYGVLVSLIREVQSVKEAEAVRVAAEAARVEAEQGRVTAEQARVQAETNRSTAESTRVDSEKNRVSSEASRVSAEKNRVTIESNRVQSEKDRASAETTRAAAENTRGTAEQSRVTAEATRIKQEQSRVQSEATRSSQEDARVTAEQKRVLAETDRETAEAARVKAEAQRTMSESSRVSAEKSRADAEDSRSTAEDTRAKAESLRSDAEEKRVAAEQSRATEHTQAMADCKKAIDDVATAHSSLLVTDTDNKKQYVVSFQVVDGKPVMIYEEKE